MGRPISVVPNTGSPKPKGGNQSLMSRKATRWSMVVALVAALALAGGTAWAAAPAPDSSVMVGAFDVGPGGMPEVFNPYQATGGWTWLSKYFSRLVVYNADFTEQIGDLAESWEVSEDGRTWTFHLRKNVKWHDGEPFTADDVRFSLELNLEPEFAPRYMGQYTVIEGAQDFIDGKTDHVSGIKVVDDYTIQVTTNEPLASFFDVLAQTFGVVPEHALADIPPAELIAHPWWKTNPIGTGPYKWKEYVPNQYVVLEANEEYYAGAPKIKTLINRYFVDTSAAVLALERGEIDFTYIPEDEVERLRNNPNLTIIEGPSQVTSFLVFNHRLPIFQDARVRQAFYYAIDREAIIETLYKGAAQLVNSFFHNPLYNPEDLNPYPYDPAKARQLLQEAGWYDQNVGTLELLTYYTDPLSTDVIAAIQAYLADVGVYIVPRVVDVPTYNATFYPGDFTLSFKGMGNGPDPDTVRTAHHSELVHPAGVNAAGINVPELDEAFDRGRTIFDPEERQRWYQEVARIQNHQALDVYMWVGTRYGAINNRVKNFIWTPAPGGTRYYDFAEDWSIEP